jgi:hypothetical protein
MTTARRAVTIGAAIGAMLLAGCDAAAAIGVGPCAGADPSTLCGRVCSETEPCPAGFYCDDGACTADCIPGAVPDGCGAGQTCEADGRCVERADGGGLDGGMRPDGGDPNVCADITVEATRVTPNVIVVVDQSSSMTAGFGSGNRWDVLRNSLIGTPGDRDGLIAELESVVRFGLALYTAEAPGNTSDPVPGECPVVQTIEPALDNLATIAALYESQSPVDETPTGEALDVLVSRLQMSVDPLSDPTIFILATDGEPDTCAQPNPQQGQDVAVRAAEDAFRAGIRTFIISVGSQISEAHLQDMANAGQGRDASDPAEFYVAGNDQGLRDTIERIIGGELSCELTLNGMIDDLEEACEGTVVLNGRELECNGENGWRAVDASTIELVGDACDTLLESPGVTLEARFPCDFILF